MRNNPDDVLRPPVEVNIWDRYVTGGDDPDSTEVRQRRVVLRYMSLFLRFGYGKPYDEEAKTIAHLIEVHDPTITWGRFQEIVRDLRDRRVLQGETTLYITPKALHVFLWTEWWDTYGTSFDIDAFYERLSPKLIEWFNEMFRYARSSDAAHEVVTRLLGPGGPFADGRALNGETGSRFFRALSEAEPGAALSLLESTLATWSVSEIQGFRTGRREIVWALEGIAIWREHFQRAARLLLHLASGENENYANNASGVFADLFSAGYGPVAPTEAAPEERFPVLVEALESESSARRSLGIRAAKSALSTGPFSRTVGSEFQGLRTEPVLWMPKTYGEVFASYRRVWELLERQLESFGQAERDEVVASLLEEGFGLLQAPNLREMVLETFARLVRRPDVNREQLLGGILGIIRWSSAKELPEALDRLRGFEQELTGTDFSSRLRRYVGTDFFEERVGGSGTHLDAKDEPIEALAAEAMSDRDLVRKELTWLVSGAAKDGFRYGYALSMRDEGLGLLPEIIAAQRQAGKDGRLFFLAGYLRGVEERSESGWEEQLDSFAGDPTTANWVLDLTWRARRLSERASKRLLDLVASGAIAPLALGAFAVGSAIRELEPQELQRWLDVLLGSKEPMAAPVALELLQMYACRGERQVPNDSIMRVLLHPSWFVPIDREVLHRSSTDYAWCELAESVMAAEPERGIELAKVIVDHLGQRNTIFAHSNRIPDFLTKLTERYPREVWSYVRPHLSANDVPSFHLTQWLGGGLSFQRVPGALHLIPPELMWEWVDEDIEGRAWEVARFLPKDLGETQSFARSVLERYGDREDVRSSLHANYGTEGWVGPASAHFEGERLAAAKLLETEQNPHVKLWLSERIDQLNRAVRRAKDEEERE